MLHKDPNKNKDELPCLNPWQIMTYCHMSVLRGSGDNVEERLTGGGSWVQGVGMGERGDWGRVNGEERE